MNGETDNASTEKRDLLSVLLRLRSKPLALFRRCLIGSIVSDMRRVGYQQKWPAGLNSMHQWYCDVLECMLWLKNDDSREALAKPMVWLFVAFERVAREILHCDARRMTREEALRRLLPEVEGLAAEIRDFLREQEGET